MTKTIILTLVLSLFVMPAAQAASCKIEDFQKHVISLPNTNVQNIQVATQYLRDHCSQAKPAVWDELLFVFNSFYQQELISQQQKVKRLRSELMGGLCAGAPGTYCHDEFEKKYGLPFWNYLNDKMNKELEPYSLFVWNCEEQTWGVKERGHYLLENFGNSVSPTMQEYLEMRDAEINRPILAGCEGKFQQTIIIPKQEYETRWNRLDAFIAKNPRFVFLDEVKEWQVLYQKNYPKNK